jgi:hypothetical protein
VAGAPIAAAIIGRQTKGYEEPYQARRDNLPPGLADSASAGRLDEVLALRDLVDQLAAAELPKGFGRD